MVHCVYGNHFCIKSSYGNKKIRCNSSLLFLSIELSGVFLLSVFFSLLECICRPRGHHHIEEWDRKKCAKKIRNSTHWSGRDMKEWNIVISITTLQTKPNHHRNIQSAYRGRNPIELICSITRVLFFFHAFVSITLSHVRVCAHFSACPPFDPANHQQAITMREMKKETDDSLSLAAYMNMNKTNIIITPHTHTGFEILFIPRHSKYYSYSLFATYALGCRNFAVQSSFKKQLMKLLPHTGWQRICYHNNDNILLVYVTMSDFGFFITPGADPQCPFSMRIESMKNSKSSIFISPVYISQSNSKSLCHALCPL